MKKNIILNGKICSGKTTKIFEYVDEAIKNKDNLVFVDTKEEYLQKFQSVLKDNNYNIIILNLKNPAQSDSFNPLLLPYHEYKSGNKDNAIELLKKIGRNLYYQEIGDPFWNNAACDTFVGLCFSLFEDAKEDEINFMSVWRMLCAVEDKYGLSDYATRYVKYKGEKDENDVAYKYLVSTFMAPNDTKGGIVATTRQKISDIVSRDNLNAMISFEDIKFDKNQKYSIFIIPNSECSAITSIILNRMIETLKSGIYILDNFDDIEHLDKLKEMLSTGPSENKYYIIGTRDLESLYKRYTRYIEKLVTVENMNNEYEYELINKDDIEYPILNIKTVKTFNILEYLDKELSHEKIEEEQNFELDSIMKQIDKKLKELEVEEKNNKATE